MIRKYWSVLRVNFQVSFGGFDYAEAPSKVDVSTVARALTD